MIFFNNSYKDLSFSARAHRQKRQLEKLIYSDLPRLIPAILIEEYMTTSGIKKRYTVDKILSQARYFWQRYFGSRIICEGFSDVNLYVGKNAFDRHIDEFGGIQDTMGNVHKTGSAYKEYLKQNNLVIRDWTPGTLKKSEFKKCENSDIPLHLIN